MLDRIGWKVASGVAAVAAGMIARAVVGKVWDSMASTPSPVDPSDREVSWRQAALWAVAAGVGAGVARVVGRRLATEGWERATGSAPPGIDPA